MEAALTAHPAVRAAVVLATDPPDRRLVTYVVPVSGELPVDLRAAASRAVVSTGRGPGTRPRSERERVVAEVWSEALRIDPIGVDEDFFHLGQPARAPAARARGAGRDPVVVGLDVPVAMLGILQAAGYYVPLDPDQPRERLEFTPGSTGRPKGVLVTHNGDRLSATSGTLPDAARRPAPTFVQSG